MNTLLDRLYIFEMANNHQGSVKHGLKIIEAVAKIARKHQIKAAVKIQLRELDTFIHPDYKGRTNVKHISRFESTRLSTNEFQQLVEAIRTNLPGAGCTDIKTGELFSNRLAADLCNGRCKQATHRFNRRIEYL